MSEQNPINYPPDFESRQRLAASILEHLSIDPSHVLLGTLHLELGTDHRHVVTWSGRTTIDTDTLAALAVNATSPDLTPTDGARDWT